jgi:hypothetical protein
MDTTSKLENAGCDKLHVKPVPDLGLSFTTPYIHTHTSQKFATATQKLEVSE